MHENNKDEQRIRRLEESITSLSESLDQLQNTTMACLVQLSRIYDVLAYKANHDHGDAVEPLLDMHEEGYINSTAPVLIAFGEPEKKENENE